MSIRTVDTENVPPLSPLPPQLAAVPKLWKAIGIVVFALYVIFASIHVLNTPVVPLNGGSLINAPDEPAHLEYIRILSQESRLPNPGGPTYEWHQPPLYYQIVAPFYGLGVPALRFLGVIFGASVLSLIFLTSRKVFPNDPELAVVAMAMAALLPMRQAISASIGNDGLTELLFTAVLFASVSFFTNGITVQRSVIVGILVGCACATKASSLLLLPIILLMFVLLYRSSGEPIRRVLVAIGLIGCIGLLSMAPWFARNRKILGEWTPAKAFSLEFAGTSKSSDWINSPQSDDLWTGQITSATTLMSRFGYSKLVANWTFRTAFGAFTTLNGAKYGLPKFMPPTYYLPFVILIVLAGVGLTRCHFNHKQWFTDLQTAWIRVLIAALGLVLFSFIAFTWTYFQAQGRYVYPAILPVSILMALGVRHSVPKKYVDQLTIGIISVLAILSFGFALAI